MEEKKKDLLSCLIAIAGPYKIRYIGAVIFAVFGVAAGMIPFYAVAKMLILLIDGNKIIGKKPRTLDLCLLSVYISHFWHLGRSTDI